MYDETGDEAWKLQGLCRGRNHSTFFPLKDGDASERMAKRICEGCPVKLDCYRYAMIYNEVGVWGGTSDRERSFQKAMVEAAGYSVPVFFKTQPLRPKPSPIEVHLTFGDGNQGA